MVDTHAATFQGNDFIVFVHQAERYKNGQQDAHWSDLSDNKRQFKQKKQDDPLNREAGIDKLVDILKKIDWQIYAGGR